MPGGVGVIAETIEAARKAKDALKVTWSAAQAQTYTTEQILQDYSAIAADWNQPGIEMLSKGDAEAAVRGAAKVPSADFFSEHVSHMCMEPLNATVKVDGDRVETWSGNQSPTRMKILAALAAGTTPDKVTVHTAFLGGGFGRKTDGDELFQTTLLAKAVAGRPVKMIWSREDDIMNDKFRPLTAQRVEVGLDASGRHRRLAAQDRERILSRPHHAPRSVCQTQAGPGFGRRRRDELHGPQPSGRVGAGRARRRRRGLARHRGRLYQVRDRNLDRRDRRTQRR